MSKLGFLYLVFFHLILSIFSYSVCSTNKISVINFDRNYNICSSPINSSEYIIIPTFYQGQSGIITYHKKSHKQFYNPLENRIECLCYFKSDKILLKTSNKNKTSTLIIFDPKNNHFTYLSKAYYNTSLIESSLNKAFLIAKVDQNKYKFLFLDLEIKKIHESPQTFNNVLSQTNLGDGKWIIRVKNEKSLTENLIYVDFYTKKIHDFKINSKYARVLYTFPFKKILYDVQDQNNKHILSIFDPTIFKSVPFKQKFSGFIKIKNTHTNVPVLIGSEVKNGESIYFIDISTHTLKKWKRIYRWVRSLNDEFYLNQDFFLAGNKNLPTTLLKIDPIKKNVSKVSTLKKDFYPLMLTDTKLLTGHINLYKQKNGFLYLTDLTSSQTKRIPYSLPLCVNCSTVSNDKKLWYVPFKNQQGFWQYLFVDLVKGRTFMSSVQFKDIELATPWSNFKFVHEKRGFNPIFIDEKNYKVKTFNQYFKEIISPIFYTENTYFGIIENNKKFIFCFDDQTCKLTLFPLVSELKNNFSIKRVIPFFDKESKTILIDHNNDCVITNTYKKQGNYFIPYKKQLLICSKHIENLSPILK